MKDSFHFLSFQAFYRGNFVALKKVHKRSIDLTRNIKKELKLMREVRKTFCKVNEIRQHSDSIISYVMKTLLVLWAPAATTPTFTSSQTTVLVAASKMFWQMKTSSWTTCLCHRSSSILWRGWFFSMTARSCRTGICGRAIASWTLAGAWSYPILVSMSSRPATMNPTSKTNYGKWNLLMSFSLFFD